MKKLIIIFLLLISSIANLYANNIDLKSYFKEIEFYKSKIVIKFKDSGARYKVIINDAPSKLSRYGEEITIQTNDTLTLKSRDSRLSISHCDKLNANDKKLFKDLEIFFQNAYVINKRANLKFIGKGIKRSKTFVFLTNGLTDNEKSSLIKILKDYRDCYKAKISVTDELTNRVTITLPENF